MKLIYSLVEFETCYPSGKVKKQILGQDQEYYFYFDKNKSTLYKKSIFINKNKEIVNNFCAYSIGDELSKIRHLLPVGSGSMFGRPNKPKRVASS